ncbi:MAG: hypothetical protein D6675_01665 [Gemmatimonadetes bacterium]|nr:MAG: hypothetical protein D6675_01665 [Gemmatimonadota bacterium]
MRRIIGSIIGLVVLIVLFGATYANSQHSVKAIQLDARDSLQPGQTSADATWNSIKSLYLN